MKATITIPQAVSFVRSRMDELSAEPGEMLLADVDDRNLERTVGEMATEAADYVHRTAPLDMVAEVAREFKPGDEGVLHALDAADGTLDITFGAAVSLLRFVRFKAWDSPYVVGRLVQEDSAAGRMQLDKWVRGRPDNPVLVLLSETSGGNLAFRYHSLGDGTPPEGTALFRISFVQGASIVTPEGGGDPYLETTEALRDAVLNQLAAMAMQAYGMPNSQFQLELSRQEQGNGVAGPTTNTP